MGDADKRKDPELQHSASRDGQRGGGGGTVWAEAGKDCD